MVAGEAMPDVGSAIGEQCIEILVVDTKEVLAGDPLDDGVIHGVDSAGDHVTVAGAHSGARAKRHIDSGGSLLDRDRDLGKPQPSQNVWQT